MGEITYNPLNDDQIGILKANGCRADDWAAIEVADGFDPLRVVNTAFKGKVQLGSLAGEIDTPEGVTEDAFIDGAKLNNVTIGNNCLIREVHSWILNANIGDNVLIMNVGAIVCDGESTFGNGEELEVLNEGGGRELKITDKTNAQVAYMNVLYRNKTKLIERLDAIADAYADKVKSDRCTIADNVQITNSGKFLNVNIGPFARIYGASSLENGTVCSSKDASTLVANGVTARDFIFQKGSSIKDRALLGGVLIGEGTKVGNQFSAEGSVMFANSEGFHSEICSIFGGPYTVTHHKSTLLIAGLFSFYNAGSATNQSNHMYKLGPVHQGIMERGCKTGSGSYLLWPSKVGAFSAVIGKHYANFDTSDFPFSYIDDDKGKSVIVPGMNFLTVGTLRDGAKWPARDRRTNEDKLDVLVFDVLSPFTGQKMLKGQKILAELHANSEKGQDFVKYQGINIKRLLLKTCSRYYRMALEKYYGDLIARRVEDKAPAKLKELFVMDPDGGDGTSDWIDMCGLLCTRERMEELVKQIEKGELKDLDQIQAALLKMQAVYRADEWNWFLKTYEEVNGTALADESDENITALMATWKKSSQKLYNLVLNDASKEFEGNVKTGFGIDGDQDADFEAVRGTFEDNSFVAGLKKDIEKTEEVYANVVGLL